MVPQCAPIDLRQNTKGWGCDKPTDGQIASTQLEAGRASMARYVARFMKNVLGENGHEAEICQRSIEIEASNTAHAAELAKIEFCESEKVKDWILHADRIRVTDAEFPSQQA